MMVQDYLRNRLIAKTKPQSTTLVLESCI